MINMSRAWDKQKNLSPRQELNLWPSVTPAMIFLRPADLKENRVCENVPARVQRRSKSRCLKLFFHLESVKL